MFLKLHPVEHDAGYCHMPHLRFRSRARVEDALPQLREGRVGKRLDARSTLILMERDAVVPDQIARVDRRLALTSRYRGTTVRAGVQRAPQPAIERLCQL